MTKTANLAEILKRVPSELMLAEIERRRLEIDANNVTEPIMRIIAKEWMVAEHELTNRRYAHPDITRARAACVILLPQYANYKSADLAERFRCGESTIWQWQYRHRHFLTHEPTYAQKFQAASDQCVSLMA
jgi:hypothetical protein